MCNFTHLHCHTKYSTLDGVITTQWLFPKLKELNMDTFAITDHGSLSGLPEFSAAGTKNNVKIIAGIEIYEVDNIALKTAEENISSQESCELEQQEVKITKDQERENKSEVYEKKEAKYWHLTLLAKNHEGYKQLLKLAAAANTKDAYYYKPRVDRNMLQSIVKGGNIVIGTGCALSRISRYALDKDDYSGYSNRIDYYANIFGIENIMCEIMANGYDGQKVINEKLISWANQKGVPIVTTNDCLGGDTIVFTKNSAKNLKDIKVGDEVLTHKGRFKKVLVVCEKFSNKKKYKITLKSSNKKETVNHLIVTEDHKWYVYNTKKSKYEWVQTKDLNDFHETFIPHIIEKNINKNMSINFAEDHVSDKIIRNLDSDLCYLIGLFCGDGHAAKHTNSFSVCVNKNNIFGINLLSKFVEQFGLFNIVDKYKDIVTIRLTNRYLSRWFRKHCYNGDSKIIPDFIFDLDNEKKSAFINGLIDSDGHYSKNIYSFDNTSLNLVAGFATIMQSVGVNNIIKQSQIEKTQYRNDWLSKTQKQYNWSSYANQLSDIYKFLNIYKKDLIDPKYEGTRSYSRNKTNNEGVFLKIKKELIEYNESVFDIQVEEDESFVTNFGAVHNCHYISKEMARLQDILLCVATNQFVDDPNRKFKFEGTSYYVRSAEEITEAFKTQYNIDVKTPGWLDNTRHFANMCEHSSYINDPQFRLPKFSIPKDEIFSNWIQKNSRKLEDKGYPIELLLEATAR